MSMRLPEKWGNDFKKIKFGRRKILGKIFKGTVANPGFFEKFLGKTICEKVSLLDIGALEQIDLTTKLPEKTDLRQCL